MSSDNRDISDNISKIKELKDFARKFLEGECATHDFQHTMRVFHLCEKMGREKDMDMEILLSSALLHDIGHLEPGDHAENSSRIASGILKKLNFPWEKAAKIIYAISVHRYTKGEIPETNEAKILQDADRLDALGAVGIMRTFSHSQNSKRNKNLYNTNDPFYETNRELNDKEYSLDHFYQKLLKLPGLMHTKTGKRMAEERRDFMLNFLNELKKEI